MNLSPQSIVEWASEWVPEANRARFAEALKRELALNAPASAERAQEERVYAVDPYRGVVESNIAAASSERAQEECLGKPARYWYDAFQIAEGLRADAERRVQEANSATSAQYDPSNGKCYGDCDCSIGQTCKAYLVYRAKAEGRGV